MTASLMIEMREQLKVYGHWKQLVAIEHFSVTYSMKLHLIAIANSLFHRIAMVLR